MKVFAYAAAGFAGRLVSVEVDIRRGLPGLDIVGLPDGAVRESRDRVRVALKRSGFSFPTDRILVNLAPAALRKEGASYDLPIAVAVLCESGQVPEPDFPAVLCAGELFLDGAIRPVTGVLPATAVALAQGITRIIVPRENAQEAAILAPEAAAGIGHLRDLPRLLAETWPAAVPLPPVPCSLDQNLSDLKGQPVMRRALEVAAAGRHHILFFGPPGSGKTLGARTLSGILPDLDAERSLETTRIWSLAGRLRAETGLIRRPPFREPHHSSSAEGLVGGADSKPGEVSLAHAGVLFLDETPEFGGRVLQSLRESLESGRVNLARAGRTWWYPADFQLQLAMNPCPCGNLGREEASCLCTPQEISRYWRRLGGALLDRIDIRVPVSPVEPEILLGPPGEDSTAVRNRVEQARARQRHRYKGQSWFCNSRIPPRELNRYAPLDTQASAYFIAAIKKLGLSSRAAHSVLRIGRTLADLADRERVMSDDVLEAVQHRRFGDKDIHWITL